MRENLKIFVEGIADRKFLIDYISFVFGINLTKENIVITDGWANIKSKKQKGEELRTEMMKTSGKGRFNLIIFDADENRGERIKEIEQWKIDFNLEFELFLFPNNRDNGNFENLLETIINKDNQSIFTCWAEYEKCLKKQNIKGKVEPLTTPANKTKIYAYIEALVGKTESEKLKIKERNRDYKNKNHWDLESSNLKDLRNFLKPFFLKSL